MRNFINFLKVLCFIIFINERYLFYSGISVISYSYHSNSIDKFGILNFQFKFNEKINMNQYSNLVKNILTFYTISSLVIIYDTIIICLLVKNLFSQSIFLSLFFNLDNFLKLFLCVYLEYNEIEAIGINTNLGSMYSELDYNKYFNYKMTKHMRTFFRFFILTFMSNSLSETLNIILKMTMEYLRLNLLILNSIISLIIFINCLLLSEHRSKHLTHKPIHY